MNIVIIVLKKRHNLDKKIYSIRHHLISKLASAV